MMDHGRTDRLSGIGDLPKQLVYVAFIVVAFGEMIGFAQLAS